MLRRLGLAGLASLSIAVPGKAAEITDFILDNGLEVVVLEDHRAPVVVQMLWYRVGAADEPPGQSGIAHYLEHLLFKGTDTVDSGEFQALVAANGGSDNAFTAQDYTGYFQRVAADRLDLMMQFEADRMTNLKVDPAEALTERDVVLEERNQRTETEPGALFNEQRQAAQYIAHPYGIPIVGWRHEIERLTLDDAMAFYDTHYAPNNAILIVAGDVEPDEVRQLAEIHYGPIPANPVIGPRDRVDEPPHLAERRVMFSDPRVAQPYVVRTYLVPERDPGAQDDAAALRLLSEVLGGSSATSVLGQSLEFKDKSAVYTSAFYSGTSLDDTTFGFVVVPAEGRSLADAEADLDRVLTEFIETGVDPVQLERIKMRIRANQIYAEDDISALARRYGAALTSGLTVADVQAWPDILQSVTGDQIVAAAERFLRDEVSVTGWFMGEGDQEVTQ
ncbi:MAG: pitrilysin family protein [Pseudomonadota bacterium]